ncbi:predicted protein [Lichtheimia corymbifera JMRC:FSU:9682]|uniref:Uncharacterized protein n=1 Tax=Lichtheimia corymbifera JMRC:FSU:9682 TaxID=1263082 RepID=A0A068SCX2_9FUNG|nr:predicted protein [Lichtheimia corymbifera JMRC:FSU:9682]
MASISTTTSLQALLWQLQGQGPMATRISHAISENVSMDGLPLRLSTSLRECSTTPTLSMSGSLSTNRLQGSLKHNGSPCQQTTSVNQRGITAIQFMYPSLHGRMVITAMDRFFGPLISCWLLGVVAVADHSLECLWQYRKQQQHCMLCTLQTHLLANAGLLICQHIQIYNIMMASVIDYGKRNVVIAQPPKQQYPSRSPVQFQEHWYYQHLDHQLLYSAPLIIVSNNNNIACTLRMDKEHWIFIWLKPSIGDDLHAFDPATTRSTSTIFFG